MPGIAIVNGGSAGADVVADKLVKRVGSLEVVKVEAEFLSSTVRSAAERGLPFVAAIGGDGTLRAAAEGLVGSRTALLPVPGGTRNHFASQVGFDSLDQVVEAIASGTNLMVDVGSMSDRVFLNNAAVGWYPAVVRRRERLEVEHRFPKWFANLIALAIELPSRHDIEVTVDGERIPTWMLLVGNGVYGLSIADLPDRDNLREGLLDLRVLRSDGTFARLRAALAFLTARIDRSPMLVRVLTPRASVATHPREIDVALDGEVMRVAGPLEFSVRRAALAIKQPRHHPYI